MAGCYFEAFSSATSFSSFEDVSPPMSFARALRFTSFFCALAATSVTTRPRYCPQETHARWRSIGALQLAHEETRGPWIAWWLRRFAVCALVCRIRTDMRTSIHEWLKITREKAKGYPHGAPSESLLEEEVVSADPWSKVVTRTLVPRITTFVLVRAQDRVCVACVASLSVATAAGTITRPPRADSECPTDQFFPFVLYLYGR